MHERSLATRRPLEKRGKRNSPSCYLFRSQMKRIQFVIIRADIDHPIGYRWRGFDHVAGRSGPQGRAGRLTTPICPEGSKLHIEHGANVYQRIGYRCLASDTAAYLSGPQRSTTCLSTALSLEGIQLVIIRASVDHPIGYRWRGIDSVARLS